MRTLKALVNVLCSIMSCSPRVRVMITLRLDEVARDIVMRTYRCRPIQCRFMFSALAVEFLDNWRVGHI